MYPVRLEGARITLRELTVEDAEAFERLINHPMIFATILDPEPASIEAVRTVLNARRLAAQAEFRENYELGIALGDRVIGSCSLRNIDREHQRADLGYLVDPDLHGQGYATEAGKVILAFGFEQLGLHRIQATTAPDNTGSQRVLEKLGLTFEGRARDLYRVRGGWRDAMSYAVLHTDPGWR